jgi:hypothetical protein
LGKKGQEGILKSMASRATFLETDTHRVRFVYTYIKGSKSSKKISFSADFRSFSKIGDLFRIGHSFCEDLLLTVEPRARLGGFVCQSASTTNT